MNTPEPMSHEEAMDEVDHQEELKRLRAYQAMTIRALTAETNQATLRALVAEMSELLKGNWYGEKWIQVRNWERRAQDALDSIPDLKRN